MRRGLALLLLVAACGDGEGAEQPPVEPRAPEAPPIHWVKTQAPGWDLELWIPEPWTRGYKAQEEQIFFAGPDADGGWQPELQFGWRQKELSLDAWAGERIRDLKSLGVGKVLEEGRATVAGMPAVYFVYGFERKAEGAMQAMREICFCFAGHGCIGFVRGVCTAKMYGEYLPIYREAAARLRYKPQ